MARQELMPSQGFAFLDTPPIQSPHTDPPEQPGRVGGCRERWSQRSSEGRYLMPRRGEATEPQAPGHVAWPPERGGGRGQEPTFSPTFPLTWPALGTSRGLPWAMGLTRSPCHWASSHPSFLRASQASARPRTSLKHALQTDRLCLLNRPLSLHLRSPQSSPRAPAAAPGGPQPQILKAREAEAWEVPSGLLGPPGTLVDMRDPRLEGALSLLLAQQLQARRQAGGAKMRGPPRPGQTPHSPPICSDSEGSEGEVAGAALPRSRHQQPTGPGSPRGQEATATEDLVPDKPLDLSEWGRGRDAPKPVSRPRRFSPKTAHTPSPEPPQGATPLAQSGPWGRSNGTKGARAPGPEAAPPPEVRPSPGLASCAHSQASYWAQ